MTATLAPRRCNKLKSQWPHVYRVRASLTGR